MTTPARKPEDEPGLWDVLHKQDEPGGKLSAEPPSQGNGLRPQPLSTAQAGAPTAPANSFAEGASFQVHPDREVAATLCDEEAWQHAVQRLRSAVRGALIRAGQSALPAEHAHTLPTRASFHKLGLVEAVARRVEALGLQLRPTGAIFFHPIEPFEDAPGRCSLCGEALFPAQRWVCLGCQLAKNLALGFLEVDEWLCQDQPPARPTV